MVKYDNWCNDCSLCDKRSKIGTNDCLLPYVEYRLIKYPLLIQDGRQKSIMATTKFSFLTFQHHEYHGDFPCIIEITLFLFLFFYFCKKYVCEYCLHMVANQLVLHCFGRDRGVGLNPHLSTNPVQNGNGQTARRVCLLMLPATSLMF